MCKFAWLLIVHMVICSSQARVKRTVQVSKGNGMPLVHQGAIEEVKRRAKVMTELLEVLGLSAEFDKNGIGQKQKRPPKYMIDLYKAVADDYGISKDKGLNADMVRSIPNKGGFGDSEFNFEIGAITKSEIVVAAELHFHLSKPPHRYENHKQNFPPLDLRRIKETKYYIKIYKVCGNGTDVLISVRRVPTHIAGWLIFPLFTTVIDLVGQAKQTLALRVEITSVLGNVISQRRTHQSYQPILVVFSNQTESASINHIRDPSIPGHVEDKAKAVILNRIRRSTQKKKNRDKKRGDDSKHKTDRSKNQKHKEKPKKEVENIKKNKTEEVEYFYEYSHYKTSEKEDKESNDKYYGDSYAYKSESPDDVSDFTGANKRSSGYKTFSPDSLPPAALLSCRRYPLMVDFEEMGWSGWIIHPEGYNAYHCKGKCSFPLSQHLKPTNHATVQSIMYTLGLGDQPVEMPCCVPDKLYDINLLYFDQNDYVVLRRYKDMVVASCACA